MDSIFDSMPNFAAFRDQQNSNSAPPVNNDSIYSNRTPFSNPVSYDTPSMPTPDPNPQSSNGGGGFFGNAWNSIMNGGKSALDFVGHKFDQFENATGLNHVAGAMKGISDPKHYFEGTVPNDGSYLGAYKHAGNEFLTQAVNLGRSAYEGFVHPDETTNRFNTDVSNATQNMDPVSKMGIKFAAGAGTDPLTFLPLGAAGKALSKASDAVGLTPKLSAAADALAGSKLIQNPVVQGTKDALGKAFVKNYGSSDGVSQGLQGLEGQIAADKMAIQQHMPQLAQTHGLTPDEVKQLPEVFQSGGSTNPKLQQAYEDLNNTLNHGVPLHDNFKIGTNAETSTMFNGKPILDPEKLMNGYYPQRYAKDLNPALQQKLDELIHGPNNGFSTSGPFNQERQFKTVGEAEANGFKPERNAYAAIAQRLAESSKGLRTSQFLQNMMDKGIFSKEAVPGMKASEIKPLSSYFTIAEKKPSGTGPLSQSLNESGTVFKPLTKLDDSGFKLPRELANSSPRYRSNPITFANDLDKAAYIIGNTTSRSARDADFINALSKHTGLSDPELRSYGQHMRSTIKDAANGVADGEKITVPSTLGNLPEHVSNPLSAEAAASHEDPNNFSSLANSLEQSHPYDKIVKENPFYIKPADESAIKDHLNPAQPTGILGVTNKLNNLYNRGFLLNPLPHMHNVTTNGIGLGEANPSYIAEAFKDIKNGTSNPWYEDAVRSGAVSGMRMDNLMKSVNKAMEPEKGIVGKTIDKIGYGSHDALWDTDSAIRTSLFRKGVEDGLSHSDAAAKTNKFMVDYNNITPFERQYIKPVVPFYAWKKGNIPLQVSQTFDQTPKYVAWNHAKDAISQAASGQPTDAKGRIQTNEQLSDGSHVALDPYNPMDEPAKIMEKGIVPWALGSLNPIVREGIAQGTSALGAFQPKFGVNSQYPIYNSNAPADSNARKGIAHAINALNPLSGSAVLGEVGNSSKMVNEGTNFAFDHLGGSSANDINTKDKPGQTTSELITKLFGGFSGRDNPAKDAKNAQYDTKNSAVGQIKYLKDTGQAVPKSLKRDAYRKVK